jgi:hypothetical protein
MIEITPKEIEVVGQNRYMAKKGKIWILLLIIFGGIALSFIFESVAKNHLSSLLTHLLSDLILVVVLIPVIIIIFATSKAGKEFREKYYKERGVVSGK